MSSQLTLLNAFSSRKSEEFKLKNIEVLVGKEDQPCVKHAYFGIFIEVTTNCKINNEPTFK